MSVSEQLLIQHSQKGSIAAFEELITPYQQKIFNLAYRMAGNYHDASDIAQEVIIKIYKSLEGFRGRLLFLPGFTG